MPAMLANQHLVRRGATFMNEVCVGRSLRWNRPSPDPCAMSCVLSFVCARSGRLGPQRKVGETYEQQPNQGNRQGTRRQGAR
jgi:hypothetical protein